MKAFCSVVTTSFLHVARALRTSLTQAGNREKLYVLVADARHGRLEAQDLELIGFDAVAHTVPPQMPYYFDAFELCNALKPFLVQALFGRGYISVIYLDSDIYAVGDFANTWAAMSKTPLLVTPHHLAPPLLSLVHTSEVAVADMGFINGGFLGWSAGDGATRILRWMCERFPLYGFCDRRTGMFVDQKLLPLLLQYFPDDVLISRDPALNIAFWNAHERPVERRGSQYVVGENAVVFFHLSGYRLTFPEKLCSYESAKSNKAMVECAPWLGGIIKDYRRLLEGHQPHSGPADYDFGVVSGLRTTPALRRLYFQRQELRRLDRSVMAIRFTDALRRMKRGLKRSLGR